VVQQLADDGRRDIIINGGNSNYREDVRPCRSSAARGIHYVDVGRAWRWGLDRGYC